MIVVGAGMAGLLAAAVLRNKCRLLIEAQAKLPNNHSAVLRFRSSIVGDALNIPFKKVTLLKSISPNNNPIADAMTYSRKTNGSMVLRSILSASNAPEERFIAPADLIQQMEKAATAEFRFNAALSLELLAKEFNPDEPIISTIPMPALMGILCYSVRETFCSISGFNVTFDIEGLDAYASLYVPNPAALMARISITSNQVIVECPRPGKSVNEIEAEISDPNHINEIALEASWLIGCSSKGIRVNGVKADIQRYAKILPVDDAVRKRFILWASERYNIYSLGRFATWRPGLLLDDLVQDIRVIQHIVANGNYDQRKEP